MKQFLLSFFLLLLSVPSIAQFTGDGFYRLQNRFTERYVRLNDGYGRVDMVATNADMTAAQTVRPYDNCLSDPASIFYIKSAPSGSGYDLFCQGTSLYSIISYYIKMQVSGDYYQAYAEHPSTSSKIYLSDEKKANKDTSYLVKFVPTKMDMKQRDWSVHPVTASGNSYLGVEPAIKYGIKYYTSYYTSFPYSFHSSGMTAYYVTEIDRHYGVAVYEEVSTSTVPQATPVFLECSSREVSDNILDVHVSDLSAPSDNILKGVYFSNVVVGYPENAHNFFVKNDTATMRVLGITSDGSLGYIISKDEYMPENSSYLTVPANSPAEFELMTPDEYQKYIEEKSKLYVLTYYVDDEYYASDTLHMGDAVVAKPAPEKEGHTFSGWFGLPETMPANDVDVYGSFSVNSYAISYYLEDSLYKSDTLEYGAEIIPESYPVREGYSFDGWSEIPATMPAHDVTVTGSFSAVGYKLIYVVDGEVYRTYTVSYGAVITPEPAPEKEGYTFSGWEGLPESMPADDVTVTGSFKINHYALTYYVDDELYKCDTLAFGDSIVLEPEPVKQGYVFSGWSETPETMPAYDVYVVGYFSVGLNATSTEVESIRYYNLIGRELSEPAEGIMIVVKTYRDGRSVRERIVYR